MRWVAFVALVACGSSPSSSSPDAPSSPATPAAPPNAPAASSAAPADPYDPLLGCASLVSDASSVIAIGDGSATTTARALVLASDRGATFLATHRPFDSAPSAPHDADVLATTRVKSTGDVALLVRATDDGAALGVRVAGGHVELVQHAAGGDALLARGDATNASGDFMLRIEAVQDGSAVKLAGKAWATGSPEPSAWQASWRGAGAAALGKIGVSVTGSATVLYALAGLASSAGVDSKDLSPLVSCTRTLPAAPPPADGARDDAGDAANAIEVRSLLRWAMPAGAPRLVVVTAGTNNDLDASGAITTCGANRCIGPMFEALEIAYASLRASGWSDTDLLDPSRVQIAIWGFGDAAKNASLLYHPQGAAKDYRFPVLDLGGANAAIHGPDAAPDSGVVPIVKSFAYTYEHERDDAGKLRDAIVALAASGKVAADHTFVVSHSWGAAYTTSMLLRDYPDAMPGVHVDLALTAAMPKVAPELGALASCAADILGDLGTCVGSSVAKLDLENGFYLGPSGTPLYRVDRPDDPVANARDAATAFAALQDVTGDGTLSGHDYVVRAEPSAATTECARATGEHLRIVDHSPASYVGVYGVDSFHVSCTVGGHVLEYRCDGVAKVDTTFCKDAPDHGPRVCASAPTDCH